ncbi:MAG: hypothetical protein ACHP65_01415 [Legionellales bacterium]
MNQKQTVFQKINFRLFVSEVKRSVVFFIRVFILTAATAATAAAATTFTITPAANYPFPSTISTGQTVSAYYLITNNTSSTRSGYFIQGLPAVVTQNTSNSTFCTNPITLAGHQACILQLDITSPVQSSFIICNGSSCAIAAVPLNVKKVPPSPSPSPPTPSTPLLVAAGQYYTPLPLFVGNNGAQTWNIADASNVGDYTFNSTSCTSSGSNSICTAAGVDNTSYLPLLYQSINGGPWTLMSTPVSGASGGTFNSTSCSASGGNSICTAAGVDYTSGQPLLYQSLNGGSWTLISIPVSGTFNATSCSSSGSNFICTAVGQAPARAGQPLLYQSTNGGPWTLMPTPVPAGSTGGSFNSTSCSLSGSNSICTAVGVDTQSTQGKMTIKGGGAYGQPLLYRSINGGTWSSIVTTTDVGSFSSTSCAYSGSNFICTAAGVDSTSNQPLLYQSMDGDTWNSIVTTTDAGSFSSTSCAYSGSNSLCTAVGVDTTNNWPLLYQSMNGGSWTLISIPGGGTFNSTSCSFSGGTSICTAAGSVRGGVIKSNPSLLYQSINGGSWVSIVTTAGGGAFNSTSCTYSGSNALCTAVGSLNQIPFLTSSTNSGDSWNLVTTTTTDSGYFNSTSCSYSGSTSTCTAVGLDAISNQPLLYQSINGGIWMLMSTPASGINGGIFNSTSCSSSGSNSLCTAAGLDNTSSQPLLYQSINGGAWTLMPTPAPGARGGFFNSTSCSSSGSNSLCTAVGQDNESSQPLLYQSINGGSWTLISTPALGQYGGFFSSTSCSSSGSNSLCTSVGQDNTSGQPLLYQSINGGSWTFMSTPASGSAGGIFNSTSCSFSGSNSLCTAVGLDYTSNQPLLYQSINGGSWTLMSTPASSSAGGAFNSTSCSFSGSNSLCTAVGQDYTSNQPLLYQSINGGLWSSIVTTTDSGVFNATSCSSSGSNSLCTVVGQDNTSGQPLLYQSINSGPWSAIVTTTDSGTLYATSCA